MLSYDSPISVNGQAPSPASPTAPMSANQKPLNTTLTPSVSNLATPNGQPAPKNRHVWIVTGPAGCGKSTTAQYLSSTLNLPYIEGDEFHPQANIDKMASGQALTDADRWDWLTALREEAIRKLAGGAEGVVVTCSALKRKYRDVIRVAPYYSPNVVLHFIYLHAPEAVLLERVGNRQGHYMGANMVRSQFAILQPPTEEETDVISVDVSPAPEVVRQDALDKVLQKMHESA